LANLVWVENQLLKIDKVLTGNRGAPLTQTLSAKRTRIGRDFSLLFLAADRSVDFLPLTVCVNFG
jgi:hypothetical protein